MSSLFKVQQQVPMPMMPTSMNGPVAGMKGMRLEDLERAIGAQSNPKTETVGPLASASTVLLIT